MPSRRLSAASALLGAVLVALLSARSAAAQQPAVAGAYAPLPPALRAAVARRGCRPPIAPSGEPGAVVAGVLVSDPGTGRASAPRDLAVLCVRGESAQVLVFRGGRDSAVAVLALWAQPTLLPADEDAGGSVLCEGGIFHVAAKEIASRVRRGALADGGWLSAAERRAPPRDGILDGDCDGVSTIHYWTGRRWVLLPGGH